MIYALVFIIIFSFILIILGMFLFIRHKMRTAGFDFYNEYTASDEPEPNELEVENEELNEE